MKLKRLFVFLTLLSFAFPLSLSTQDQKPIEPFKWKKLAPFLGKISGWKAESKPRGATKSIGTFKITRVERDYTSGDKSLEIEIVDGGYAPEVYAAIKATMNFEIDTSGEYVKKITIKEFPGLEKYYFEDKEAEVTILVADRFIVNLEGKNFKDASELKEIAKLLDFKKLVKLTK